MHLQKCGPLSHILAANTPLCRGTVTFRAENVYSSSKWSVGLWKSPVLGEWRLEQLWRVEGMACALLKLCSRCEMNHSFCRTSCFSLPVSLLLESVNKNLSGVGSKNPSYRKREAWLGRSGFQVSMPLPPKFSVLGRGKDGPVTLGSAVWKSPTWKGCDSECYIMSVRIRLTFVK